MSSPIHALSPNQHRNMASATSSNSRRHRIIDEAAPTKGLWPSSSSSSKKSSTLADHFSNERLIDFIEWKEEGDHHHRLFTQQRSCSSEFTRFDSDKEGSKENHGPACSSSMRFTRKFKFLSKKSSFPSLAVTPKRLFVDDAALDRRGKSDSFFDCFSSESDASAATDVSSTSALVGKPRKARIEVVSRFLQDRASWTTMTTTSRKRTSDHSSNYPAAGENLGSLASKNRFRRTVFLTAYSSATLQWALSLGQTAALPIPSRSSLAPLTSSGVSKNAHQLRMFHNRMLQWRFANAKAKAILHSRTSQAEVN